MRIRMKSKAAGPEGVLLPEHEYELPTGRAKPLIDGGYAVPVGPSNPAPVETATRTTRETTAARTGKPPGKPARAKTPHAPAGAATTEPPPAGK
jgi:hypothetical protein